MSSGERNQDCGRRQRDPIAIVGMACRFPGAPNTEEFWKLLNEGREAIAPYSERRGPFLDPVMTPEIERRGAIASLRGGFLPGIDGFDAEFFGLSPREAQLMDPQHRMLLELSWEALESAGIVPGSVRGSRTGVYVAQWTSDYEACLSETLDQVEFHATTGTGRYAASGRISFTFDFRGPALTLDTGCSSSLVAVHLASRALWNGDCEMALVGAANLILRPDVTLAYSAAGILSRDGRCKFGDAAADGYVRSEGGAVLVLKRLSRALADHDPIEAVILGSAVTSHGQGSGLMIRPGQEGLEAMLAAAWEDAGIDPAEVAYIEAHGPGTAAGDPVELGAIRRMLGDKPRSWPCLVGSVKTNIGHLEGAAGLAGLVKTVLALKRRRIPASLHLQTANPAIAWEPGIFQIPVSPVPWPSGTGPATAGVSSFGITGTTAHVVVREAPAHCAPRGSGQRGGFEGHQLLLLSAKSPTALRAVVQAHLDQALQPGVSLRDVCYTAAVRRTHHEFRAAFVARDVEGMRAELEAFLAGEDSRLRATGRAEVGLETRVAFVFPGQGSQWAGMGRDLLRSEPVFREAFEAADRAVGRCAGWSLMRLLQSDEEVAEIDRIQPLLFGLQVALHAMWKSWGVEASAVVGHSMGEVAAAYAAGALSLDDAARVVVSRSRLMREVSGRGGMAVLGLSAEEAAERLLPFGDRISVAAMNSPTSTVVSGDADAIAELVRSLQGTEVFCRAVNVDVASHSSHMEPLKVRLAAELEGIDPRAPGVPLCSTVTGRIEDGRMDPAYWGRNLREPVQFARAADVLLRQGCNLFIELSPHPVLLNGLNEVIAGSGRPARAIGSLRRNEPERAQMLRGLGDLFATGCPVDWSRLYPEGNLVPLPAYPWQRERFWFEEGARRHGVRAGTGGGLGERIEIASEPGLSVWSIDLRRRDALVVKGVRRCPVSMCLELVMEGVKSVWGLEPVVLADVVVGTEMDPAAETEVQLSVRREDTRGRFELRARQSGAPWRQVLHGRIRQGEPDAEVIPAAEDPHAPASLYEEAAELGVVFDSELRVLERVEEGRWTSRAELRHDGSAGTCFEGMTQLVRIAAGKVFRIRRIGEVAVAGSSGGSARVETSATWRDAVAWDEWIANAAVRGAAGELLACMRGIELELEDENVDAPVTQCAWEETWRAEPLPAKEVAPAGRRWIILGDSQGAAEELARRMELRGATARLVAEGQAVEWNPGDRWDGVIVIAQAGDSAGGHVAARARERFERALSLVQPLVRVGFHESPRLWMVTCGAEQVLENAPSEAALELSGIRPLGRVVAREHPELRCTNVDLGPRAQVAEIEALIDSVLGDDPEDVLAIRGGDRLVCRLGPAQTRNEPEWPVRTNGAYLITGGLGGLGLGIAARLIERGAGKVVLVGRRAPGAAAWKILRELQDVAGERVEVRSCDVSDPAQVRELVSTIHTSDLPLVGVIHAAAVNDDQLVRDITPDCTERVYGGKASGAWNLHEATLTKPLEWFVLFSSIASVVPQPGHGSYSAANGFLDALAEHRRAAGLPAVALRWGVWTATGLWSEGLRKTARAYRAQGIDRVPSRLGHRALGLATAWEAARVVIAPWDRSRLGRYAAGGAPASLLRGLMPVSDAAASAGAPPQGMLSTLFEVAPADRAGVLEEHVRQTLGRILKVRPERIDPTRPMGQLGLDSVMGLELVRRLSADLEMRLPASLVYNHPTIRRISTHLLERLEGNAPATASQASPAPAVPVAPVGAQAAPDVSDAEALAELMGGRG